LWLCEDARSARHLSNSVLSAHHLGDRISASELRMKRRDTLALILSLSDTAGLSSADAQTFRLKEKPVLGILSDLPIAAPEMWASSPFWSPLREMGWTEGLNFQVERASSYPDNDRLPGLAAELVRKRVDVIFAASNESAVAAARATRSIPIVFWGVNYPVELGLVDSLANPGGNVTGIALYVGPDEFTKTIEFLKEAAPDVRRLSYLYESAHMRRVDGSPWQFADEYIEVAARRLGIESHQHALLREQDVDAAFAQMLAVGAQALYVSYSRFTIELRQRIIEFADNRRLPSAFNAADDVLLGGLLSYGPDLRELFRLAASLVDKVLRGASPRALPVELPRRFQLVVNRRTARLLGLRIPMSLEVRADRFVE
jgi:putative tryptophan/tyrosine transport system substrate-binding protein